MKRSRIARVSGSSRLTAAVERHAQTRVPNGPAAEAVKRQSDGALLAARVPGGTSPAQVDITNMYP